VYLVHIDEEAESSVSSVIESYVLRVTDLDKATEFWEKAIGAEVVSRSESDDATNVTLRSPIGGGGVTLRRVHGDDRPIEMGHSLFRQYMNTSDSAGLYRHAVNLGYDATHDPFDVPGRVNVVKSYTRQPDGYLMDLCEFQGEAGKRILHGQVDAKEHASGDRIATYIGPTAIYVTDMDKSVDFWTRLGGTVMDRVEMGDYMEITQMRGDTYGVVVQLMEVKGARQRDGVGGEAAERTAAVMPAPGKVDLGTGFLGFRVATDDCGALHEAVVAGGYESVQAPTADGDAITAKVLDPDGYPVEIRQPGTGSAPTR
jgi:catechol 2,3-dioxygenase-like lactoylglutathione lyase family enzyme